MKRLIPIIVLVLLAGCKTQQVATTATDSVRVEVRIDSVYVWKYDSIYITERQRHDTVYLTTEKYKTLWRDKVVQVHDTITTTQEQVVVQEVERERNGWDKFSTWFTVIVLVLIVLYIAWRIVKAVYLRK